MASFVAQGLTHMLLPILALVEGSSILAVTAAALVTCGCPTPGGLGHLATVLLAAVALSLAFVMAFCYAGLYELQALRSVQTLLERIPRALIAATVLVASVSLAVPAARLTDDILAASLLVVIGVVFGPFLPLRVVAIRLLRRRRLVQRLLVVGASPLAGRLVDALAAQPNGDHALAGVVDDAADSWGERKLLGPLAHLDKIIDEVQPDRIVVALADWRRVPALELLNARGYRGIPIQEVAEAYERLTGKLAIEALTPSHLLFTDGFRPSRLSLAVRRGGSLVVAALGLLVTAPLLGVIAVAIKLDSPGPVLFTQQRTGFRGKSFRLFKFRTMHPVDRPPSEWVRDNEHRITRVGRWLRRFWLDELPQLFNILRGDMNLVGPRPHPTSNYELLMLVARNAPDCGLALPYYSLRCMVRPGLTGWAQVRNGYANDLDEELEKLRYDLYYLKHQSFWLDLRIIFTTLKHMIGGQRAQPHPVTSDRASWRRLSVVPETRR